MTPPSKSVLLELNRLCNCLTQQNVAEGMLSDSQRWFINDDVVSVSSVGTFALSHPQHIRERAGCSGATWPVRPCGDIPQIQR